MAAITASEVKALRERTGAGMMDCKKALLEANGDQERAIDLLRKTGAAKAAKRSGKSVSEGTIAVASANGSGAMVEVLSETDFVARSEAFTEFANRLVGILVESSIPEGRVLSGDELMAAASCGQFKKELEDLRVRVGENVQVGRAVRYQPANGGTVVNYVHFGSRIAVLLEVSSASGEAVEAGRGVAMHVAATNPRGVSPDDLPEEAVERERALLLEQAQEQGKPPSIVERIVDGRMRKFFEENALLWQSYVKDPDVKVKDVLAKTEGSPSVRRFQRFAIGG